MGDAFVTALRVGLEGALAAALGSAALRPPGLRRLALPFAAAVALGLLGGFAVSALAAARGLAPSDVAPALHRAERRLRARPRRARAPRAGPERRRARRRTRPPARRAPRPRRRAPRPPPRGRVPRGRLARARGARRGAAAPCGSPRRAALSSPPRSARAPRSLGPRAAWAGWLGPSAALSLLLRPRARRDRRAGGRRAHAPRSPLTGGSRAPSTTRSTSSSCSSRSRTTPTSRTRAYQLILCSSSPRCTRRSRPWSADARSPSRGARSRAGPAPAPGAPRRAPERRIARAAFLRASPARRAALRRRAAAVDRAAIWSARARRRRPLRAGPRAGGGRRRRAVVVPLAVRSRAPDDRMRKWVYAAGGRAVTFFTVRRPRRRDRGGARPLRDLPAEGLRADGPGTSSASTARRRSRSSRSGSRAAATRSAPGAALDAGAPRRPATRSCAPWTSGRWRTSDDRPAAPRGARRAFAAFAARLVAFAFYTAALELGRGAGLIDAITLRRRGSSSLHRRARLVAGGGRARSRRARSPRAP